MASKRSSKTSASPSESEPFEVLMTRLEGIVGRLEEGELTLEESLTAYEQGIGAVRIAQGRLDAMDARLEQLTRDGKVVSLAASNEEEVVDPRTMRQPPPAEPSEFDDDTQFS